MKATPVPGEPALTIGRKETTLVVADLHVGIEAELRESGIMVPEQTGQMTGRLLGLCARTGAARLLMVGDLKHNIPSPAKSEARGLAEMMAALSEDVDVEVVPGNHDGGLASLLPGEVKLHDARGIVLDGVGFFHGHAWPTVEVMECAEVVMGHNHPAVAFRDALGIVTLEPCWLRGAFDHEKTAPRYAKAGGELIVMPSFTQLRGGTAINSKGARLLGPLFANEMAHVGTMEAYLLDGTRLGRVEELEDEEKGA